MTSKERILELLKDAGKIGMTTRELHQATSITIRQVSRVIKALKKDGVPIARIYLRTDEGLRTYIRTFYVFGRVLDGKKPAPFTGYEMVARYRKRVKARSMNSVFNLGATTRQALKIVTRGSPSNQVGHSSE